MAVTAKHVIFKGRVQGVGFRYTSYRIAGRYDITGYVRNLPDGTVEMLAQGEDKEIQGCLDEIEEYFGDYIRDRVITETTFDGRYTDFKITY